MTINLNKYEGDLKRVFGQVIDPKDTVNWSLAHSSLPTDYTSPLYRAIFGYEGTSNALKVVEFGGASFLVGGRE